VTGIGGIFFKAKDPTALARWYREHLGIRIEGSVALFAWRSGKSPGGRGHTVWSIFPAETAYFGESGASFMIKYRVKDLDGILGVLREEGIDVDRRVEDTEYGRCGWITDPEGNRIELWQPPKVHRAPETAVAIE
jgi:predicted enzyme related to lactoylglutathione lyase